MYMCVCVCFAYASLCKRIENLYLLIYAIYVCHFLMISLLQLLVEIGRNLARVGVGGRGGGLGEK